jgi:PhnB protein
VTSRLNPYLSFPGTARQAMEFYASVFGGELTLNTYADFGGQQTPEADNIMHGALETGAGFTLMGADQPPGTEHRAGNSFAVCLNGDDEAVLRAYWGRLSEGGEVSVPLEKQMWGDEFGQCTDRFGVTWMVDIGSPQG